MKFGICVPSILECWEIAQEAETLGFNSIRLWDSPLVVGDIFVMMSLVASRTSRIRVGSLVYVPWTRNPAVTACGFASVNAIAPGRVDFCPSTGFTARRTFGLKAMPYTAFEAHVRAAIGLMRGEEVDYEIEGEMRRLRLMHPKHGMNVKDPIRMEIAASGPKGRALVADLGTGWADVPGFWGGFAIDEMRAAWSTEGRQEGDLHTMLIFGSVAILHRGESRSSDRIRSIVGPAALASVHYWVDETLIHGRKLPETLPPVVKKAVAAYTSLLPAPGSKDAPLRLHEGHCLFVRPEEDSILTDELMSATTTFVGEADELRERMDELKRIGVGEVSFGVRTVEELKSLASALGLPKNRWE